ncbi:MAG TPA: MBL fold metallo-hydrolase [bacterium]|nr:MBL fold metallo-hydrolase [bacterium]
MPRLRLDPGVSLTVLARTDTARDHDEDWGCGLQGEASARVRHAAKPLVARIRKLGEKRALAQAGALVRALEKTPRYAALCEGTERVGGRRRLREEIVFPRAIEMPRAVHLRRGVAGLDVALEPEEWSEAAELFGALTAGATPRELEAFARRSEALAEMLGALSGAGWLVPAGERVAVPPGGVLFAGHNTVVVAGRRARVLVDPWIRPDTADDRDYHPLQPADLPPVDAIVITHSHGDHFHAGSLLAFGRDVRIFVPDVSRESLLSSDLKTRLRMLGFRRVEALPWWKSAKVGDVEITALPFYGEQPWRGKPLYDGLWNEGNTYRVRTADLSCAFLADSGSDVRGDMVDVARRVRRSGKVDVVFTGIRGFRIAPLFYGFTTVDAFFVNVPLSHLTEKQQLMNDAKDALETADAFGARWVVPYADGGAPWYWREGMGPGYPGYTGDALREASRFHAEDPDSDPFPERLAEERARRKKGAEALLLRPGDAVRFDRARPRITRVPGFAWPFGQPRRAG